MTDLRAFLRRHIEAFLDYEFGPAAEQNVTPPGCRRPVWTPEHTQRLVGHLAANWKMVEEAERLRQEDHKEAPSHEVVSVDDKGQIWTRADIEVRDALQAAMNTMGEAAADNAQADAAGAEWGATPEDAMPPVNPEVPW